MKVIFTGVGSIGSRHVRNLTAICRDKGIPLQIDVIRHSDRVLPDDIKAMISNEIHELETFDNDYDVAFITEETKTHFDSISMLENRTKHMFIEKPIFDNTSYDLSVIEPKDGSIYYVACPIRYSNYYREISKVINLNEVYSARIIFSSYMPDWQKGRDYRKSFRCFTDRGGGVDIDSIHEIDYMTSLFGFPKSVKRVAGKYSSLEMEACDVSVYIFDYYDKVIEMHLDYIGRVNNRRIEIFARDDVVVVDYNKRTIEKQLTGETVQYVIEPQ